jgi:tetratricopeptide (TPR) repeat protein
MYSLLIVAVTLLAYANSFSGPFIFDDSPWIEANPHIRHLWPLWKTLQPPEGAAGTGRSVVCLTLALNYAVSGLDPWSYHLANLVIYVCAALVLFGIVRRTATGSRRRVWQRQSRFAGQCQPLAHYNMSLLLTDLGDIDEALPELQKARDLLPDNPEILFKLGVLLSNHGRYAEACAIFTEALRLNPDFEPAREYLRFCEKKGRKPEMR